jgi:hypothetical protein
MTKLRHYTSFEDLKNSPLSNEPSVSNKSAAEKEKQFIEFIDLVRSTMEPVRRNQKSDGKQLH